MAQHTAQRPAFPGGWSVLEITPEELSLANTLPVGQTFMWHRQPIPRPTRRMSSSSSSSSSSGHGGGFFVKQEDISDSESEPEDQDFADDHCEEEWSRAIPNPSRVILLRQTSTKIWYTSILPSNTTRHGSESISLPDLDLTYLCNLFQLPPASTLPSTPSLYSTFTALDPLLFGRTSRSIGLPKGIRVLRQEPWETTIAFITSSANNVGRITGLMKRLAGRFGEEILSLGDIKEEDDQEGLTDGNGLKLDQEQEDVQEFTTYHLFPSPDSLHSDPELETTLRNLGFGYRANFISTTLSLLAEEHGINGIEHFLRSLRTDLEAGDGSEGGEERWRKELLRFKGVGRKVADCIGLMSLDRPNVVPIDTHLQQIAARHPSFPARLKGKPTSGETVYKEVQSFLEGIWSGVESKHSAGSVSSSGSGSSSMELGYPQEEKKRSPRKKRKIEVKPDPETLSSQIVELDTSKGMGMAGWAQAIMFAADLKGSKAVKVEKVEEEEEMMVETRTVGKGDPFGAGGATIETKIKTKRIVTTIKRETVISSVPAVSSSSSTSSSTARLQAFSNFTLSSKPGNSDLFDGKSDIQAIRKNSAVHDVYNRLHSVNKDMAFVERVRKEWYGERFPVVANQRCGLWYCDPETSSSQYAYFKSTDGHTGAWDFVVRRANLQLVDFASRAGGIILVDSTRRGKRMPDALSKTVPIWCTVINRANKIRGHLQALDEADVVRDMELYTPSNIVSPTERAQILARIDGWVQNLLSSSLTLPILTKPLRPYFIHPGTTFPPACDTTSVIPIICLSASTFIEHGGPESMRDEFGMFEYIQGSGDDHELWGKGLSPQLFQSRKEEYLRASRQDISAVIFSTLAESSGVAKVSSVSSAATELIDGSGLWLGVLGGPMPTPPRADPLILSIIRRDSAYPRQSDEVCFLVPDDKKGDHIYATQVLPHAVGLAVPAILTGRPVFIRDEDGKDLSIGVATACLWHLFDDNQSLRDNAFPIPAATKDAVRRRLDWILNKRQGANPARKTLQKVNTFLITPPRSALMGTKA